MYIQMKILGVAIDPGSKGPVVLLRDTEEHYTLPIWVGLLEAASISHALEGVEPPRPMTHDLMKSLIQEFGARVSRIDVDALEDNVYHAKIHLQMPGGAKRLIDSRPSDAMALALRCEAEIFAEESILRRAAAVTAKEGESGEGMSEESWKEFLENLDPDAFGKYKM